VTMRRHHRDRELSISTASRIIAQQQGRSNPRALARVMSSGRLRFKLDQHGKRVTTSRWLADYLRRQRTAGKGGAR